MSPLVVLLAHGSPDPRSSAAVEDLAERFEAFLDGPTVRVAYLNHNWPTLTAAVGRERDAGSLHDVVVLPLLLSNASHALRDVPAAVADAERDSRISITVGETVGMELALAVALDSQAAPGSPIVLAWAGGRSTQAQSATQSLVARWREATGREIVAAPASESGEFLRAAVEELQILTGLAPTLAIFTMFPGVLADQVLAVAQSLGLTATTPLYNHAALVEILALRLSQTTGA
jgi:sirohydrochlorin ferrochelatase